MRRNRPSNKESFPRKTCPLARCLWSRLLLVPMPSEKIVHFGNAEGYFTSTVRRLASLVSFKACVLPDTISVLTHPNRQAQRAWEGRIGKPHSKRKLCNHKARTVVLQRAKPTRVYIGNPTSATVDVKYSSHAKPRRPPFPQISRLMVQQGQNFEVRFRSVPPNRQH